MNYNEALDFLKSVSGRGSIMGLERISALMKRLGSPQEKIRIIHISGTNGKGSFGAMMTSVLRSAGYTVGGFSSPAITGITDHFRINCKPVSNEDFAGAVGIVAEACKDMPDMPTEFEILTAAAFVLFVLKGCDIAVVECGMGGDTDSTNVISSPLLSVITNIQYDHCGILGNTLEEIASHKAGIIKNGCPVYYGGNDDVYSVIRSKADESESEIFRPEWKYVDSPEFTLDGTSFTYKGVKINISLCGTYQLENAVNVLSCIDILRKKGAYIPYSAVCKGLSETEWHGRFEIIRKEPYVIYDGSHNPDGIKQLSESIRRYFGDKKTAILMGVMADKEYSLYPEMLSGIAEKIFTVKPENPRSLNAEILAETFSQNGIPAESFENLPEGVKCAYSYAREKNIPLIVIGTLYMYKEFTEAFSD